jgi:hypothetical protein
MAPDPDYNTYSKATFFAIFLIETNQLLLFQEQGDARHDKRPENKHNFCFFTIVRSFSF